MIAFILFAYGLLELYVSLKVGEIIGFWYAAIWIILSALVGLHLLRNSSFALMQGLQNISLSGGDIRRFEIGAHAYLIGALLILIPGVVSDFLGVIALGYSRYLHLTDTMTQKQQHFTHQNRGEDDVIDVEIIEDSTKRNPNT